MRILQLSKKFPFPIKDGECLAITELAKSLVDNGAEVSLLAMDTIRHPAKKPNGALDFYKEVHKVKVDNAIKPIQAFLNLFSSKSYHIERFESDEFKDKLKSFPNFLTWKLWLRFSKIMRKHSLDFKHPFNS